MWAAATALAPEPVTPDSAFALRKHLQLTLPPGDIHHLLSATGAGDRIVWSPTQRAALLNWLMLCSRTDQGEIGADSPLARALAYWIARYQAPARSVRPGRVGYRELLLGFPCVCMVCTSCPKARSRSTAG